MPLFCTGDSRELRPREQTSMVLRCDQNEDILKKLVIGRGISYLSVKHNVEKNNIYQKTLKKHEKKTMKT